MQNVDMLITVHFGIFWFISMIVFCGAFAAGVAIGKALRDDL